MPTNIQLLDPDLSRSVRIHEQLCNTLFAAGLAHEGVIDDPIAALQALLDDRAYQDWRDAFMASLTRSNPVQAAHDADVAVEKLAKRRAQVCNGLRYGR